jgi:hypothetical protein
MAVQLDRATLEAALVGYQRQLDEIESKIADLRRRLGRSPASALGSASASGAAGTRRTRRRRHRMSAEGRARIAAAQRARWAKFKKRKPEA